MTQHTLQYDTNQPFKSHNKQQRSSSLTQMKNVISSYSFVPYKSVQSLHIIISIYYCADHGRGRLDPQRILGGLAAPRRSWLWAIGCVFQVCLPKVSQGRGAVWATRVTNFNNLGFWLVVSVLLATLLLKIYFDHKYLS